MLLIQDSLCFSFSPFEEFLLILLNAEEKSAVQIANRIREAIAALRVLPDDKVFTASFGVARIAPGDSFETFYQRVDGALYKAKRSGKNCVYLSRS